MDSLIFEAPSNSLSFGNVSLNFLREMYKKKLKVAFFPIGNKIELDAFDKADKGFKEWVQSSYDSRLDKLKKGVPTLKLWHLNGSEVRIGTNQVLYTFYEASSPTPQEKNLASLQSATVFSSKYASDIFSESGVGNCSNIAPGFDTDFCKIDRPYLPEKTHFGLMGKWEDRKNTSQIIKAWAKRYGGDYKYQLTCCVTNPFFKPEQMNQVISRCLGGVRHGNINFLPFLKTNSEVNDLLNSIDIDLTGLSGAEGWNLPSFNASALGKWSVVLNCTSHKDWATPDNSILVEPEGTEPIYDGVFFKEGAPFNQGIRYTISQDKIIEKMELAENFVDNKNHEGEKLKEKFTYEKTLNSLLNLLNV